MNQSDLFIAEPPIVYRWQWHGRTLTSDWRGWPRSHITHRVVHRIDDVCRATCEAEARAKMVAAYPGAQELGMVRLGPVNARRAK